MRENKNYKFVSLCLLLIALSLGIPSIVIAQLNPPENQNQNLVQGIGEIVYLSFEGGFFGIISDNGNAYDPINLPSEFEIVGLRVEFRGEILDLYSFHMWGRIIKILFIRIAST
ncbi:MAG: hypothetical protein ACFFA4_06260 [Promethearchaeota archaeon]